MRSGSTVVKFPCAYLGVVIVSAFGCSSPEADPSGETHPGLSCGTKLNSCDIYLAGCRQDVLDVVACLRGYDTQVRQPEVAFIQLQDLLDGAAPPSDDRDQEDTRRGYALFDLIAAREVSSEDAFAAQANSIAAFYSASTDQVYILDNPGGVALSEAELGISVEAYRMSVLAHEYVHFLQDIETDLDEFSSRLPEEFDAALAGIAAIEGEAVLYEGLFQLQAAGRRFVEAEVVDLFEQYIDFAEQEIRVVESPALEARYLFPYTYGAHSAALSYFEGESEQLEQLRHSHSTLEYIQRRWGVAERRETPMPFRPATQMGLEQVNEDQLGPWLLSAFWGRVLGASPKDALDVAQQWSVDRMRVWRTSDPEEVVAQWVVEFTDPTSNSEPDVNSELIERVLAWREQLESQTSTPGGSWFVRADGPRLEITSSNRSGSAAALTLATAASEEPSPPNEVSEGDADAGAESSPRGETRGEVTAAIDAGMGNERYSQRGPVIHPLQPRVAGTCLQTPRTGAAARHFRPRGPLVQRTGHMW